MRETSTDLRTLEEVREYGCEVDLRHKTYMSYNVMFVTENLFFL